MTAGDPHALLARLTGRWEGRARLWFEPGDPIDDEPVTGEIVPLHGGRWVRHEYATRLQGDEHAGTALLGCELSPRRWQVAWVDTFHTGGAIMFSEGTVAGDAELSVLGSYEVEQGPPWGWRTTYAPAGDRLLVRHYNLTPDGEETLAVEFDYRKVAPSPR